ncbi:hypothetical protein [Prauserella endophytica]|uniref:Uncharacterized protein n=1 Tax=Prauserella endophytica TaxID=1592324 RepID=A0ABY2RS08_9PSEU|nr:hypothetical protein [Prauserella endophytica]TKG57952.1 hypothetical protein FCN18_38570 [Prauserella endophytica]
MTGADAHSWQDWQWPEWMPRTVRREIETCWSTPALWLADAEKAGAPELGEHVEIRRGKHDLITGRYVHFRDRLARLVHDNGVVSLLYLMLSGDVRWVMALGEPR